MTEKAISPLRQRLVEDMTIRRLGPKTQHDYIRHVTTVCLPTPTGPAILHWPVSSLAYPIQRRQASKAVAPKLVSNTKSGTLVRAVAGA